MITLVGSSTVTVTAIEARTAIDSAATDYPFTGLIHTLPFKMMLMVSGIQCTETTLIVTSTIMFSGLDTPSLQFRLQLLITLYPEYIRYHTMLQIVQVITLLK